MIRVIVLLFFAVSCASWPADFNSPAPPSPILDPEKEGLELAAKLRSAAPTADSRFTGVLQITTRNDKLQLVPLVSQVSVSPSNWQVVYRTASTYPGTPATLTIIHTPGEPNQYLVGNDTGTNSSAPISLTQPFAGSDFWLMDLGLEFVHWPQQRAVKSEMSRGRPCRVLESVASNPPREGYTRVLSWVDLETGAVIQAEAYDRHNKLLKRFTLGSFKKVNGQWQLRDMKIRNARTGQQTELKFDLHN